MEGASFLQNALLKRSSEVTGQPVERSVGSGAQPWSCRLWPGEGLGAPG